MTTGLSCARCISWRQEYNVERLILYSILDNISIKIDMCKWRPSYKYCACVISKSWKHRQLSQRRRHIFLTSERFMDVDVFSYKNGFWVPVFRALLRVLLFSSWFIKMLLGCKVEIVYESDTLTNSRNLKNIQMSDYRKQCELYSFCESTFCWFYEELATK